MTFLTRVVGSALTAASLSAVVLAQKPALELKMGLWEVTTVANVAGMPLPQRDTSKMTPAQKERMEAMMGPRTSVSKTCLTKESFDRGNVLSKDDAAPNCSRTLNTNSRSVFDSSLVCTGERPRTSQVHFEALSPTSLKGTTKITSGPALTVSANLTGKWIAADCGDVK